MTNPSQPPPTPNPESPTMITQCKECGSEIQTTVDEGCPDPNCVSNTPTPPPAVDAEKLVDAFYAAAVSYDAFAHDLPSASALVVKADKKVDVTRAAILAEFSRLSTLRAHASSSSGSERASIAGVLHAFSDRVGEGPERFVEEIVSILRPFPAPEVPQGSSIAVKTWDDFIAEYETLKSKMWPKGSKAPGPDGNHAN